MGRKYWLVLAAMVLLASCKPNKPTPVQPEDTGTKGVFVLNEGNFTFASASLSYIDIDADTIYNNLFYKANNAPLGDVGQSLALSDGKLYIVVNNSNYIYKVDATTTAYEAKITGFYSPREMHFVAPDKAYVTDLIGKELWIINPQTMSHTGSIAMGKMTEKMVQVGQELYVSNWSHYYDTIVANNTVQVVDINNDVKVAEITVGKEPNTMAVDKNGHVWVLCEGAVWESNGEHPSLWEIDPRLKTATKRCEFEGSVVCLRANPSGDHLYIVNDNVVRRFDIASMALSGSFRIDGEAQGMFYNMAVEPSSGDIYVADAKNFSMSGKVFRYSSDGVMLGSYTAGIIPSAMLFK